MENEFVEHAMAIMAVSTNIVRPARSLERAIDILPDQSLTRDMYLNYAPEIQLATRLLEEGITLDDTRKAKYESRLAEYNALLSEYGTTYKIYVGGNATIQTLEDAKNKASVYQKETEGVNIEVIFNPGRYEMDETVAFTSADSGKAGSTIVYKAATAGTATLAGSKELDFEDFSLVTDVATLAKVPPEARGKIYSINLTGAGITPEMVGDYSNILSEGTEKAELFVNGKRQTVARYPNGANEYMRYTAVAGEDTTSYSTPMPYTFTLDENRGERWATATDAYAVGFWGVDFHYEREKVESFGANTLKLASAPEYSSNDTSGQTNHIDDRSNRIAVINLIEELDIPGEYYIDKATNTLYYYPVDDIETISISVLGDIISMDGVENITFDGINFTEARGNAIHTYTDLKNITIQNCRFDNLALGAVDTTNNYLSPFMALKNGEEDAHQYASFFKERGHETFIFKNNVLTELGCYGLQLICGSREANVHSGSVISGNIISHIGAIDGRGEGIYLYGVGITVSNNTMHDLGYAISFRSDKTTISGNEIYNSANQLADAAAIYTGRNFINRGNVIEGNYIHNTKTRVPEIEQEIEDYYGETGGDSAQQNQGIYLDDCESGVIVRNNYITDCDRGIFSNKGSSNTITGNVIGNVRTPIFFNVTYADKTVAAQVNENAMLKDYADRAASNAAYDEYKEAIANDTGSSYFHQAQNNTVTGNQSLTAISLSNIRSAVITITGSWVWQETTQDENSKQFDAANNTISGNTTISSFTAPSLTARPTVTVGDFALHTPVQSGSDVIFVWNKAEGADRYELTYDSTTVKVHHANTEYTNYEAIYLVSGLAAGEHTWSVKAISDQNGASKVVSGGSFTVEAYTAPTASTVSAAIAAINEGAELKRGMTAVGVTAAAEAKLASSNATSNATLKAEWLRDAYDMATNEIFIFNQTRTTVASVADGVSFTISFDSDATLLAGKKVIVAGYDVNGRLVNSITDTYKAEGISGVLTGEGIATVKVFTWDDISGTMQPIYGAAEVITVN